MPTWGTGMFHLPFLSNSLPFSFPFSPVTVESSTSLQVGERADAVVHIVVCQHTDALPPPVLPHPAH